MNPGLDYKGLAPTGLPRPRPGKTGSFKIICLAIVAVGVLAGASYWLTRPETEKENLRQQAAAYLDSLIEGTPLASFADRFRPSPPPPPESVTKPATESGSLSGRTVTATIAAPMDFGGASVQNRYLQPRQTEGPLPETPNPMAGFAGTSDQRAVFNQEPLAPVTEDSRIRPGYVAGVAQWLANHYKPGPRGGSLTANMQALNQECGVRLAAEAQGGRAGILRYAFHPAMINALYSLYIDRFMADLAEAARNKGFTPDQARQFHRAIAGRAAIWASVLAGVQRVPDLAAKLDRIDGLAQKAVNANADLTTSVFEMDELRNAKAGRQTLSAAQMRVDGATARYRRASDDHAQAQSALASEIRRYSGQNLDEEAALFMAAWVARRYSQGGQARGAIESCIAALRDLSARCARYGEGS